MFYTTDKEVSLACGSQSCNKYIYDLCTNNFQTSFILPTLYSDVFLGEINKASYPLVVWQQRGTRRIPASIGCHSLSTWLHDPPALHDPGDLALTAANNALRI